MNKLNLNDYFIKLDEWISEHTEYIEELIKKNRLREKKAKYTIAEIIKLTKGEYQSDVFAEFFKH